MEEELKVSYKGKDVDLFADMALYMSITLLVLLGTTLASLLIMWAIQ